MAQKNKINLYDLFLIYYVSCACFKSGHFLEIGSCSIKICQTISANSNNSSVLSYCSCSSSCSLYKDCCSDSSYRNEGQSPPVKFIRLSVSNRADYKAVAQCSASSTAPSTTCMENIGKFTPVTSKVTGVTYTNKQCAACNDDAQQLVTWKVTLSCCPEHDDTADRNGRRFTFIRSTLYSVLPRNKGKCECKYQADAQDGSLDKLELRRYGKRDEISQCSSTWNDDSIRSKCNSFIEPVYSRNKMYRNLYCAKCNYERMDKVHCQPEIVRSMLANGQNVSTIYEHCLKNKIPDCMNYFGNRDIGKGTPYGIKDLVNIDFSECIPPSGRKCCRGYRYDSTSDKCRRLQ